MWNQLGYQLSSLKPSPKDPLVDLTKLWDGRYEDFNVKMSSIRSKFIALDNLLYWQKHFKVHFPILAKHFSCIDNVIGFTFLCTMSTLACFLSKEFAHRVSLISYLGKNLITSYYPIHNW